MSCTLCGEDVLECWPPFQAGGAICRLHRAPPPLEGAPGTVVHVSLDAILCYVLELLQGVECIAGASPPSTQINFLLPCCVVLATTTFVRLL